MSMKSLTTGSLLREAPECAVEHLEPSTKASCRIAVERGDIFEVEGARRDGPLWRWDLVDEATLNIHLRIDGHHIIHWSDGGPTELDNLVHR